MIQVMSAHANTEKTASIARMIGAHFASFCRSYGWKSMFGEGFKFRTPCYIPPMTSKSALALVIILAAACTQGTRAVAPAAPTAPAEVIAAAKAAVETWRQAYEVKSMEGLAKLYRHDLDLVVVQDGTAYQGWSSVEAMLSDRLARATQIHIRLKDTAVAAHGLDVATVVATMTRERTEGSTTTSESGTLTLVLERSPSDGRWLVVLEHYSYKRPS